MRLERIIATMALVTIVSGANAQANCDAFNEAIDSSIKEISFLSAEGIGDNSAPRESNRKTNQLFHMSMINANLVLMQAGKCPLPKTPIHQHAYKISAQKCMLAILKANGTNPLPDCDRSAWVKQ